MTRQVVVTRPRNESIALATELIRRGYDVLTEPMLDIVPLNPALPKMRDYDALAFTSANGVDAFASLSKERALPAYAVGGHTAAALKQAGFTRIYESAGDSSALAEMLGHAHRPGARILHAAGKIVAQDLGVLLAPHEIAVDRIALYDAIAVGTFSQTLVQAMYARTVTDVLLFSTRTAATFGTLATMAGLSERLSAMRAVCFSPAIASEAARLPWKETVIAVRPTTDALLDYFSPLA